MDRERFETLVGEALEQLPSEFAEHIENVEIVVEDRPTAIHLEGVGLSPGDTLLGLYVGTSLADRAFGYSGELPDVIYIFQAPIEDICDSEDDVVREVRVTVAHEVGHYFGLSEDEIEATLGP